MDGGSVKNLSKAKISSIPDEAYTGKAVKPGLTVTHNGRKLAAKNYTLTYKNNVKIGTATVTVKGKGDYTESVSIKFKIVPGKAALHKLNAGKNSVTVQIKKQSGGVAYQIQYKRKGSKAAYKSVYSNTPKAVIQKLDAKQTYAVRVRAYKKIGKKTYNGKFSAVKYQKTK